MEIVGETKDPEEKDEVLNSQKALWLRSKSEVTQEEYDTFYKQISNDFQEPAKVIHYTAEGMNEFRVLLFIPPSLPMEFQFGDGSLVVLWLGYPVKPLK